MHDPFVPTCSHCSRFVHAFPGDSPLGAWGFCTAPGQNGLPAAEQLQRLEAAACSGDFAPILATPGLYPEGDDGCEAYQPR